MSEKIRVSILRNPFKVEREDKWIEPKTIQEIIDDADFDLDEIDILVIDKDVQVDKENWKNLPTSDHLIIRAVPKGEVGMLIGGILSAIVGVVLMFTPLAPLGALLIGTGVGLIVGGAVLMSIDIPQVNTDRQQETLPSIRGSRNRTRAGESIAVLLGKHLTTPDNASMAYPFVSANDQYLRQLFCFGYKNVRIDEATMKIGDTLITQYNDIDYELQYGASAPNTYLSERCVAASVQQTVPDQTGDVLVRTTANNTKKISVILNFPQGLTAYNDDGDRVSHTVPVRIRFRNAGTTDSWITIFEGDITAASRETLREEYTYDLDNLTSGGTEYNSSRAYEVDVSRATADSTDTKIIDDLSWDTLKSFTGKFDEVGGYEPRPIIQTTQEGLGILGVRIRASDQLSGVIDQMNFEAYLLARDWDELASGPANWIVLQETRNPAAMLLYVLTNADVNPEAVDDNVIDWVSLEEWWSFCDTNNFECNAQNIGATTINEMLNKIVQCGRASWSMVDNKYTIIIDHYRPLVVQYFTPRNTKGFSGTKAFSKKPTTLKVQFVDASIGYEPVERLVAYDPDTGSITYDEENDTGEIQELSTYGVTDATQAAKIGAYSIACPWLRQEVYMFEVDFEYLICTRGDRVQLTHDVPLYGLNSGRILGVFESTDTDGFRSDEEIRFEAGEVYGVTIRYDDGSVVTKEVTNPATTVPVVTQDIYFDTPISGTGVLFRDFLFMFGYSGSETRDMIITDIAPGDELSAKITAIDYAPDIFTADQGSIPVWDPGISKYNDSGGNAVSNPISDIPDVVSSSRDAWHRAAEVSATALNADYYATAPGQPAPTNTPAIPTLTGEGIFRGFLIRWDQQVNLRNPYQLELQVSSDDSTWYSLGFGTANDTDWQGVLGEFTAIPESITAYTQAPTPFIISQDPNGEDFPEGLPLYYRIRRRTLADVVSIWSDSLLLTSSVIEDGTLGYNVINANNIKAGAITADLVEAAFINTTVAITIGYVSTTGGSLDDSHEGDRRVYIDGDEVIFTVYRDGIWATDNVVKLGGSLNGEFLAALQARYLLSPGATDRIGSIDIGDLIPDASGFLIDFEKDFKNTIRNDAFFSTIDGVIRDGSAAKWGTYGAARDGGSSPAILESPGGYNFTDAGWFIDFYTKWLSGAGGDHDLMTIENDATRTWSDAVESSIETISVVTAVPYAFPSRMHVSDDRYISVYKSGSFLYFESLTVASDKTSDVVYHNTFSPPTDYEVIGAEGHINAFLLEEDTLAIVMYNSTLDELALVVYLLLDQTTHYTLSASYTNTILTGVLTTGAFEGAISSIMPMHSAENGEGRYCYGYVEYNTDSSTYWAWSMKIGRFDVQRTGTYTWVISETGFSQVLSHSFAADPGHTFELQAATSGWESSDSSGRCCVVMTNGLDDVQIGVGHWDATDFSFANIEPTVTSDTTPTLVISGILYDMDNLDNLAIHWQQYQSVTERLEYSYTHIDYDGVTATEGDAGSAIESSILIPNMRSAMSWSNSYTGPVGTTIHRSWFRDMGDGSFTSLHGTENAHALNPELKLVTFTPSWNGTASISFEDNAYDIPATWTDLSATYGGYAFYDPNDEKFWLNSSAYSPAEVETDVIWQIFDDTTPIFDRLKIRINGNQLFIEMDVETAETPWSKSVEVLDQVSGQWDHFFIGWSSGDTELTIYFNGTSVTFSLDGSITLWADSTLTFDFESTLYAPMLDDLYTNPMAPFTGDASTHYARNNKWSTLFDSIMDLLLVAQDGGVIGTPDSVLSEQAIGAPFITSVKGVLEDQESRDAYDSGPTGTHLYDLFQFINLLEGISRSGQLTEDEVYWNVAPATYDAAVPFADVSSRDWCINTYRPTEHQLYPVVFERTISEFFGLTGAGLDSEAALVDTDVVENYSVMYTVRIFFDGVPEILIADSSIIATYMYAGFYAAADGSELVSIACKITLETNATADGFLLRIHDTNESVGTTIAVDADIFKDGWNTITMALDCGFRMLPGTVSGSNARTVQQAGMSGKLSVNGKSFFIDLVRAYILITHTAGVYWASCKVHPVGNLLDDGAITAPTHIAGVAWGQNRGRLVFSNYNLERSNGDLLPSDDSLDQYRYEVPFARRHKTRDLVIKPYEEGKIIMEGGVLDVKKGILIGGPRGIKGDAGDTGDTGPEGASFLDGGTWDTIYLPDQIIDGGGWS